MLTNLALAALLALTPVTTCPSGTIAGPDGTLRGLYEGGQSFDDFLAGANRRVELWHGNHQRSEEIDVALLERARAVPGTWRFLAIAVAGCSDSVSTIPFLARLVGMVEGLEMSIVDSRTGREIMESHRTPDGRPATPTVLLLDDGGHLRAEDGVVRPGRRATHAGGIRGVARGSCPWGAHL
jgi:hypothetical protein